MCCMWLGNEQYEEIKQVIIDTFIYYKIKCIPISSFELATKMGLKVIPYSSLGKRGKEAAVKISRDGFSIERQNKSWLIYYNDECGVYGRINYTIMHEIGHYALGHLKEGDLEEAEANFFAKYALAPPPLVHNFVSIKSPIAIQNIFEISQQAALFAYKYYKKWLNFGLEDYTDYELRLLELFEIA